MVGARHCYTPPGIADSLLTLCELSGHARDKKVAVRCREPAFDSASLVAYVWPERQPPYRDTGAVFFSVL